MDDVYSRFGFDYSLELSTRPEKKIGTEETWDLAEEALTKVIKETKRPWKINEGDGAFYGPKIDVKIKDLLGRSWQLGTFQLDFQLPMRFNLSYKTESSHKCPVIIHRALLGSLERFIAILTEHTGGKWPFWLNPKQVCIVPIIHEHNSNQNLCIEIKINVKIATLQNFMVTVYRKYK